MKNFIKDLGMRFPTEKSNRKARYGLFECSKCSKNIEIMMDNAKKRNVIQCKKCSSTAHGILYEEGK